jgi:hypothetical protein
MNDLLKKGAHLGLRQLSWSQEQKQYERQLEREAERKAQEEAEARAAALQPQQQDTGGYTLMTPEQQEWANMMINAMNQMGSSSKDPRFHSQLASQYLGLLGQLQPQDEEYKRRDEAMEMIQLGQMLGDEEMMSYGQNVLREFQGMDPMPTPGTDEYRKGVREDAYKSYFAGELPAEINEMGDLTGEGFKGVEAQMQAEENPNLVKQYYNEEPNWFQRIQGVNPMKYMPGATIIQGLTGLPVGTIKGFFPKDDATLQEERLKRAGFKF